MRLLSLSGAFIPVNDLLILACSPLLPLAAGFPVLVTLALL